MRSRAGCNRKARAREEDPALESIDIDMEGNESSVGDYQAISRFGGCGMPFKRSLSIHVDAPPEVLYDYLTDLRRHPEWADQPMEMTVHGEQVQPGTTFSSKVKLLVNIHATGRVVEMQKPERFVYECKDSAGEHRWTMEILPEEDGSRLTQTLERIWVPFHIKMFQAWVMWPLMGRPEIRNGLANIKTRVEALLPTRDTA
jgi:uncharacterized protein YndB with AHSA1/START domain